MSTSEINMSLGRNILLWASRNEWSKNRIPKINLVKKAVKRFMPGESIEEAITAAKDFSQKGIPTTFTHLGENIKTLIEAEENAKHYLHLLDQISNEKLDIEISLKLTQIGLDLSFDKTLELFNLISLKAEKLNNNVFIDIEDSSYVDKTIAFYKKMKENHNNIGLCLQAYLYRTMNDLNSMIDINPCIRLVKGAYKEPSNIAFPKISQVNENYLSLAKYLLEQIRVKKIRVAFGTHDIGIQEHIIDEAERIGLPTEKIEFQMLYGIKNSEQMKLAMEGYQVRTLISYGDYWFPWYMRRLAERPANVFFILKNIFNK